MKGLEPITKLLAGVLPNSGERPVEPSQQDYLAHLWQEKLGLGEVSVHSWPLLFTSGRLVVFTESAIWGNELRHQSSIVIRALAQHGIQVNSVVVKTRPASTFSAFSRPTQSAMLGSKQHRAHQTSGRGN